MQINPLKQLYSDFVTILEQCVVKYKVDADNAETLDTKKEADAYITAMLKQDSFYTYYKYDRTAIAEALGLTDETEITYYVNNRDEIPFKYRDDLVAIQRQLIIDNYVEKNNYYRCLMGLPDYETDESDYIYPTDEEVDVCNLTAGVPIHEIDSTHIAVMRSHGYIDAYITKYPSYGYLKFLGNKKIDLVIARTAKNFAMLRIPSGIEESTWNNFSLIYEQCREYFMSCIYITEYRSIFDYYDCFIALCIMVMTLQQVISRVLKSTIERDFFDPYCVKILFDAYGVPYYSNMTTDIQTAIVQNLNLLVLNKGTNQVIYDIASILGYDRIKVYKYYLMRCQKFDVNGVPIVKYKIDEDTGEEVLDYQAMFDVYFQALDIDDMDAYKSLLDTTDRVEYEVLTEDDPYWVDDDDLLKDIYESEYNYIETKYMGVSITYRMSKILFENVYLLRMILDKKDEIPNITLSLPKIDLEKDISLFDAIIMLCALTCKQNHLTGEILTKPSMILHIMGFNFEEDYQKIRQEILDDPLLDDDLVEYFEDMTTPTAERINDLYKNFLNLYDVLLDKMTTTQDIETYEAYKKLYHTIYYSNENQTIFNIGTASNPKYASTFLEYMQYSTPDLYELVVNADEGKIYQYATHIIGKLSQVVDDLQYTGFYIDQSASLENMLVELIQFFKSYTTDMLGLDTIYVLDMKPETLLRLIDKLTIDKTIEAEEDFYLSYADSLKLCATFHEKETLSLWNKIGKVEALAYLFDTLKFSEKALVTAHESVSGTFYLTDLVNQMISSIRYQTEILFKDSLELKDYLYTIEKLGFTENAQISISNTIRDRYGLLDLILIGAYYKCTDGKLPLQDRIQFLKSVLCENDTVAVIDKLKELMKEAQPEETLRLFNLINSIQASLEYHSHLKFRDTIYKMEWV